MPKNTGVNGKPGKAYPQYLHSLQSGSVRPSGGPKEDYILRRVRLFHLPIDQLAVIFGVARIKLKYWVILRLSEQGLLGIGVGFVLRNRWLTQSRLSQDIGCGLIEGPG